MPKQICSLTILRKGFGWHNEDSCAASEKLPIYAVADGVTLPKLEELIAPSESKLAADLFCKKSVEFLENNFDKLSDEILKSAYKNAARAVKELNKNRDIVLSTVAALVAVKDGKIFGSRLTDCGFALIRDGKLIFKTPEFWSWMKSKKRKSYGVIGSKLKDLKYIDVYNLDYKLGDILTLFSDGFENHFSNIDFLRLFKTKNFQSIEPKIRELDSSLIEKDEKLYGNERTLLFVQL